jgi:hypothetical protein
MADTKSPELMHLYNLPQNVEGGLPVHGVTLPGISEKVTVMFHKIDEMSSDCTVEGRSDVVHLPADTPIMYDYETDQYSVAEDS